jgi:hypothetical protein
MASFFIQRLEKEAKRVFWALKNAENAQNGFASATILKVPIRA